MALVQSPFWVATLTFRDRDGNAGSVSINIDNTAVFDDIETDITTTFAPLIAALSDATLTEITVTKKYVENAPALAPESSDVERKGSFSWRDASGWPLVMQIPSFRNTMVVDNSNTINTADTAVAAFLSEMLSGALLGAQRPVTSHGTAPVRLVRNEKVHRKSDKG